MDRESKSGEASDDNILEVFSGGVPVPKGPSPAEVSIAQDLVQVIKEDDSQSGGGDGVGGTGRADHAGGGSNQGDAEAVGVGGEGEVQQLAPRSLAGRSRPAVVDVDKSLDHPVYQPLAPRQRERGKIHVAFSYMLTQPNNSQGRLTMRSSPPLDQVPANLSKSRDYFTLHPLPHFPSVH